MQGYGVFSCAFMFSRMLLTVVTKGQVALVRYRVQLFAEIVCLRTFNMHLRTLAGCFHPMIFISCTLW